MRYRCCEEANINIIYNLDEKNEAGQNGIFESKEECESYAKSILHIALRYREEEKANAMKKLTTA